MRFIKRLRSDQSGVAAIEYAVIGAVVLAGLAIVFSTSDVGGLFNSLKNSLADVAPP